MQENSNNFIGLLLLLGYVCYHMFKYQKICKFELAILKKMQALFCFATNTSLTLLINKLVFWHVTSSSTTNHMLVYSTIQWKTSCLLSNNWGGLNTEQGYQK